MMILKKFFLSTFILLMGYESTSQAQSSSRFAGLGASGAALQGLWAIGANPSGVMEVDQLYAGVDYSLQLITPAIGAKTAVFAFPLGKYVVGANIHDYGLKEYREQGLSLVYAGRFGEELSIGVGVNYHRIEIEQYGSSATWSVDAGMQYKFGSHIIAGVMISNPAGNAYNREIRAEVPVTLGFGISYKVSPNVLLNTDITGKRGNNVSGSAGIEYEPFSLISFRGGVAVNPFSQHVGIGFRYRSIYVDVAADNQEFSGKGPHLSLTYGF